MSRRTIIIAISAVVVLIVGLVVFNVILRRRSTSDTTATSTDAVGTLPDSQNVFSGELAPTTLPTTTGDNQTSGTGSELQAPQFETNTTLLGDSNEQLPRLLQLTDAEILSAGPTTDSQRVQYFLPNGTLHTVSLNGQSHEQKTFAGIDKLVRAEFSPSRDRALLQIQSDTDPDGIGYEVLVLDTAALHDLHPNVGPVTWDDTGTQLLYIYYNATGNYFDLSVSQNDGSRYRSVKVIDSGDYTIGMIPGTSIAYYYTPASGAIPSTLYTVSLSTAQESVLSTDQFGFDARWSPDGQKALFFQASGPQSSDSQVYLFDRLTGKLTQLRLHTTADKVVWGSDSQTVYLALPDFLGTLYPDDYKSGFLDVHDTFWRINVSTGAAEQLTFGNELPQTINATKLFLSDNQHHLFFLNQVDRRLYSVNF